GSVTMPCGEIEGLIPSTAHVVACQIVTATRSATSDRVPLPLPPDDLMTRVGVSPEAFPSREARAKLFDEVGRAAYTNIRDAVPYEVGQTILDFGCGAGRILRWFTGEPGLRLTACDIHEPSIAWMQSNFDPRVRLYVNDEAPPLPETDDTFDLIYCSSV